MAEIKDGESKFKKQKVVKEILSIEDQRKNIVARLKTDFYDYSKSMFDDCYNLVESNGASTLTIEVSCKCCKKLLQWTSRFNAAALNLSAHASTHMDAQISTKSPYSESARRIMSN